MAQAARMPISAPLLPTPTESGSTTQLHQHKHHKNALTTNTLDAA